jgi:hypothetical protein
MLTESCSSSGKGNDYERFTFPRKRHWNQRWMFFRRLGSFDDEHGVFMKELYVAAVLSFASATAASEAAATVGYCAGPLSAYSGAGHGCDVEKFVELDDKQAHIKRGGGRSRASNFPVPGISDQSCGTTSIQRQALQRYAQPTAYSQSLSVRAVASCGSHP